MGLIVGDGYKQLVRITVTGRTETADAKNDDADSQLTGTVVATDGRPFWVPELARWSWPKRKALDGLTPSQIDDLAKNAGYEVMPGKVGAKNPATRYYLPDTNRSQGVRVLPQGVPGQAGLRVGRI